MSTVTPPHWISRRLRFLAQLNPSRSEVRHLSSETLVTFVPMESIREWGGLELDQKKPLAEVYSGYTYFRNGDVLVAKITPCFENGKGALARDLEQGVGFGTTELHVLRPGPGIDARFLLFVTLSTPFRDSGTASMIGAAGQKRITEDFIKNYVLAVPPLSEQQSIAAFLETRTTRVDELVAKRRQLIQLLSESRNATIARLVTKGLDRGPSAESGVPWIGSVPAHWDVVRTRFVAKLESGHTPSRQHPEYWVPDECTVPWFTLADVWQLRRDRNEYLGDTAEKVSPRGLENSSARLLPAGTVVLSRTASVGFSGIMPEPMATSQDFVNWICGPRIRPEYLLYVFRGMRSEFSRLTMGSTHQTIYMPDVRNFRTPVPPLEEQDRIVDAVRRASARYDRLIDTLSRQIERLVEYRQTLISAAVTGQVDIRARELEGAPA